MQTSRRVFLGALTAGGGLALAGCRISSSSAATTSKEVDPLAAVLNTHAGLRDSYAAALVAAPSLAPQLTVLHQETVAHVEAIAAAMATKVPPTAAPDSASPTTAATSSAAPPPTDPATLVTALHQSEINAGTQLNAIIGTIDAKRAPLLGSIAASCACHVVALS